jgi:conjugative transfer signal peptidase TraF
VRWRSGIAFGLIAGVAGVGVQSLAATAGFRINVTESLPVGIYRVVQAPITRGAYVLACAPEWAGKLARERGYLWRGPCPGRAARLGKQIVALAGDIVELTDSGLTVNGARVPNSAPLARDTRGRLLPVLRGRWVVPLNGVWLWAGWSARSFDSRYFGPVHSSAIGPSITPVSLCGHHRPKRRWGCHGARACEHTRR